MALLSPQEIAEKWARNTSAASASMTEGVNAVSVNPMEKAAAAEDRWIAGVQRAASSGKWRQGLLNVSLADWKDAMITKGIPRIAQGVAKSKPKFMRFMTNLLAHISTIQRELESMPRGDLEQNLARMNLNARRMAEFRNT